MTKRELSYLYNKVFDEEGNMRVCGRNCCKNLISALNSLSGIEVGNLDTGFMCVIKVRSVYDTLMNEEW